MRPPVLTILMGLYALFGIGFLLWTALGLGAAADSPFALPLPVAAMVAAGVVNLAIAAGIWRRAAAMRWLAVAVHAVVTIAAVVVTVQKVADGVREASTYVEMAAKFGVHAALFWFWLRAGVVARWFGSALG